MFAKKKISESIYLPWKFPKFILFTFHSSLRQHLLFSKTSLWKWDSEKLLSILLSLFLFLCFVKELQNLGDVANVTFSMGVGFTILPIRSMIHRNVLSSRISLTVRSITDQINFTWSFDGSLRRAKSQGSYKYIPM